MPYSSRKTMKRRPKGAKKPKNKTMKKRSTFRKNVNLGKSIEKKIFDYPQGSVGFAQATGSGLTGHNYANPTPEPANGTAVNERIGNRIMVTGARLDLEFSGQASLQNEFRYRWYLIRMPDSGAVGGTDDMTDEFLDPNPFDPTKYDWHSPTDHERSSSFRIVATGTGKLIADSITGQTSRTQIRKYLKLGHILKYDNVTAPPPVVTNQYRLIFLGDSGNTTTSTGAVARFNIRWYYTDN